MDMNLLEQRGILLRMKDSCKSNIEEVQYMNIHKVLDQFRTTLDEIEVEISRIDDILMGRTKE